MKNGKIRKYGKLFTVSGVILALLLCIIVTTGAGTSDDPLITESYLEKDFLPRIISYIDQKVGSGTPAQAETFKVVSVSNGKSLICDAGTEMILRSGSGTIIATAKGGVSDVTAGADLPTGMNIPLNHLLIAPLGDGRGLRATSDILVMVRGGYNIQ